MIMADKIIMLRKKNGWSQEELAEKVNVSRQSVSKWEGALSVPELDKVLQLASIFGVSTDYLLKDEIAEEDCPAQSVDTHENPVRRVSMAQANEFLSSKDYTAKRIALAVFMCICSPICLLLLGAASELPGSVISDNVAGGVGIITLLLIVAPAVAILIFCGTKTGKFDFLENEEIETEYGVSGMVRERMEKFAGTYTKYNIIGTCICILSVVPLLTGAFTTENDFYIMLCLSATMILAGIGTVLFIVGGIKHASMQKLLEEGEYTKESKRKSKKAGAISTVYWLVTVALYLGYSFYTDDYSKSWIVWPIAGVIYAALMALVGVFIKTDKR